MAERVEEVSLALWEDPVERGASTSRLPGDVAEGRLGDSPAADQSERGVEYPVLQDRWGSQHGGHR